VDTSARAGIVHVGVIHANNFLADMKIVAHAFGTRPTKLIG
jgi:hypothetical protein